MMTTHFMILSLGGMLCLGVVTISLAAPYQPLDDEVLLQLPTSILPTIAKTLTPNERLMKAQVYFEKGRHNSDPRAIGSAQRLLKYWENKETIPIAVLLLRAKILQYRHHFVAARQDLKQLLKVDKQHAEAWLTLAFVERVQGHYKQALIACNAAKKQQPIAGVLCQTSVFSLQGKLKLAYQKLTNLPYVNATTQQWQYTEMAIIQSRLGYTNQAQKHFQQALLIPQRDPYLLAAYADFLLANQQAKTAFELLQDQIEDDSLLLRALLAAQVINAPEVSQWSRILQARFETAVLRQEFVHQREAARFTLFVEQKPQAALVLAQANWAIQKEPEDALLLIQAAQVAKQMDAAKPAQQWAKQYHWTDILEVIKKCVLC